MIYFKVKVQFVLLAYYLILLWDKGCLDMQPVQWALSRVVSFWGKVQIRMKLAKNGDRSIPPFRDLLVLRPSERIAQ